MVIFIKKTTCVAITILTFCLLQHVFADAYPFAIEARASAFSGNGEIRSFDVNEAGEVLICVQELRSGQTYISIFNLQGDVLCSLYVETANGEYLSAAFENEHNIVLHPNRGRMVFVLDQRGNFLYSYERGLHYEALETKNEDYCENIIFTRDFFRSKITMTTNQEERVFYEIGIGNRCKLLQGFAVFLLLILFSLFIKEENKRRRGNLSPIERMKRFKEY